MEQKKGTNKHIDTILRFISDDDKTNMQYFFLESLSREYRKIDIAGDINALIVNDELSYDDTNFILNYSGYNYKHINAVLRGTWNYEDNGNVSNMPIYRMDAEKLREIITSHPSTLSDNLMAYRGVDISYFKQYGIETLGDLKFLEGHHIFDSGFISTSLQEDKSFFKKENELGLNYNVKIEYMIPKEFKDGIYLDSSTSYTPQQQEYLINAANLSRVSSVVINADNTAVIRATLIPKELYDDYYKNRSNVPGQK